MPKILIVEDKANNVEIITRLLGRSGFDFVVAGNKAAAVEAAITHHPDLILMDIRMPLVEGGEENQTAGLDATRELKAMSATAGIPVIALTGDAMRDFKSRMAEAGFNDFIEKPVTNFADFLATVRKHLAGPPP